MAMTFFPLNCDKEHSSRRTRAPHHQSRINPLRGPPSSTTSRTLHLDGNVGNPAGTAPRPNLWNCPMNVLGPPPLHQDPHILSNHSGGGRTPVPVTDGRWAKLPFEQNYATMPWKAFRSPQAGRVRVPSLLCHYKIFCSSRRVLKKKRTRSAPWPPSPLSPCRMELPL